MFFLYFMNYVFFVKGYLFRRERICFLFCLENQFLILFLVFELLLDLFFEGFDLSDMSYLFYFL